MIEFTNYLFHCHSGLTKTVLTKIQKPFKIADIPKGLIAN